MLLVSNSLLSANQNYKAKMQPREQMIYNVKTVQSIKQFSNEENKTISFSGNLFSFLTKNTKNRHLLIDGIKSNNPDLINEGLKSFKNTKDILKVLHEDSIGAGFSDPKITLADIVLNNPEKLQALAVKLKELGAKDPLSEVLNQSNSIEVFSYFPESFVAIADSLLAKNKNLITKKNAKELDELASLALKSAEISESPIVTHDLIKELASKILKESINNQSIV